MFLFIFLLSFNFLVSICEYNGQQPRIYASSGHLVFKAAEHRNISFLTTGKGRIYLNNEDLTAATTLARNASEVLMQYESHFYETLNKVKQFEDLVHGRNGIVQRMAALETSGGGRNVTGRDFSRRFLAINNRILNVQRSVRRLNQLLTFDECSSDPCKNGGKCKDIYNGVICFCREGWEGQFCETDVNECAKYAGTDLGCQNGATCINREGSYECACAHGWHGIHCTRRKEDCNSGSPSELCGHGTCISENTAEAYKCICDQGWTTDGTHKACTIDVDECSSSKPPCSTNPPVRCINVPGSFFCGPCPQGYTGNGYTCIDIDECAVFNGGCSVNPLVQCINTPGSRICGFCPPGYEGNGLSCSYKGVCNINNGGCHHLAQCRDNPRISSTYVECLCPAGFIGSGIGTNGCVRPSESSDPCSSNPCLHGTCLSNLQHGTYECRCTSRYTGRNCDIRKNPCQPNPCQHDGICISLLDLSFTCNCTSYYTGSLCEQEQQACGGRLRNEVGVLQYPSASGSSSSQRIGCAWVIETNPVKVLNITFLEFHTEDSPDCQVEWLQIHDGRNTAAQSLGRFCGNRLPNNGSIITTHNVVYLWLRANQANSGFRLTWNTVDPVCGGTFTFETHGTIKSPGSPGNYPPNRDCYWYLNAPENRRVEFHFFLLDLGSNKNCNGDYLEFLDGSSESDQVFAKFCENNSPEPLVSPGHSVVVHFHSDGTDSYSGFQISYSALEGIPGCGGVFTNTQGDILSPTVDGKYPNDLVCEYKIRYDEKSRIKVTFLSMNLEESPSCEYDYVALYEGANAKAPLIGKYCGKNLPPSYTTVRNELFIVFKSDWGVGYEGFHITYGIICGNQFTESSGIITSPGYPSNYSDSKICIYEIIQPPGTVITLTFDDFQLENLSSQPECFYDYVEIRDGDSENSTLIGRYCSVPPPPVVSSYNYLYIKFESDSSVAAKGFKANYTTKEIGCGGILKKETDIIRHPNPKELGEYLNDMNCTWLIVAPPGKAIQLSWLLFQLEDSGNCAYDYLIIYDSSPNFDFTNEIGRYCGNKLPPMVVSSGNNLALQFITDATITRSGFMFNYVFLNEQNVCGGSYFTSSGVIKSPNYPNDYLSGLNCEWIVHTKPNQQIMLKVLEFNIESSSSCKYDWLEIRNGGSTSSPLIGKYCDNSIPKQIPSHTNQLYIRFKSDSSVSASGFKMTWESTSTGCGGTLSSSRGSIVSPHYPELYHDNAECYWKIAVSAGSIIRIMFSDIDIEKDPECSFDYVEIFDDKEMINSLGKYCMEEQIHILTSSTNYVTVKFRTDFSYSSRGFSLQYFADCNNTLTGFGGIIESLNFPNNYPANQNCIWRIEVPRGNKINITFSHFKVGSLSAAPENGSCTSDYLEIKYSDYNVLYNKYCGDLDSMPFITIDSNLATIHFVTYENEDIDGSGFRLEWQLFGCGGILKRPEGTIMSPGYPNAHPEDVECKWQIVVDFGKSIQITFDHVDLEQSYNCTYDHIQIINGPSESYPELTKLCSRLSKPLTLTSTGNFMFVHFVADTSTNQKGFIANYTSVPSNCGGRFTAPKASFTSPNYPSNYERIETCEYSIEVADSHVIELKFDDFDIASDPECEQGYVKVFDGPSQAYPVLRKLCGSVTPNETIRSSYNHMFVEMVSKNDYSAKGFKATYSLGCGAHIKTQGSGLISVMDNYLQFMDIDKCVWIVTAEDPSQHVSLTVTYINTGFVTGLEIGKIHDGESNTSPLLQTLTEDIDLPVTSSGSSLYIEVNSGVKFQASYSVFDSACGATYISKHGYFATPNFPKNYPFDLQCEWVIQVAPGNSVKLSFISFDILQSKNCSVDYLEIRETNSRGKLVNVFCGSDIPADIIKSQSLWLLFKSSPALSDGEGTSSTGKGFKAEYTLRNGNQLSGARGQIASPFYPAFYGADYEEQPVNWRITVDFGKRISIIFKEFYVPCSWMDQKLQIYDGYDESAPELFSSCGFKEPEPVKSFSNIVYITLYTVGVYARFLLEWMQIENVIRLPVLPKPKVPGCGSSDIIDMSQTSNYSFTSPGYPEGYASNLECEWIFSTTPENHLAIYFQNIDIENILKDCLLDKIQIYDGIDGTQDWKLVKTVCFPNASYSRIHVGNLMKVVFKTDSNINGTGFSAVVLQKCGGNVRKSRGVIQMESSENAKHIYNRGFRKICQWNVTVKSGKTIRVLFDKMDIESQDNDDCTNYILLRNGKYPDSPMLGKGKYCKNEISQPLNTTGNHLYIKYNASFAKSFALTFEEVGTTCGGEISLNLFENETYISSPNYPNIPPPHTECSWVISAPPGEILRIDFVDRFDLITSQNCQLERVEVRDGGSVYSPELGVFCDGLPSSIFSTNNYIFVKFVTDVEDPRNGFKARIGYLNTCGGTITGSVGEIKENKKLPPKRTNCTWYIQGPADHYLNIKFKELPSASDNVNCSLVNHIEIWEKAYFDDTQILINSFCGNATAATAVSSTNKVTVNYITYREIENSEGFWLTYTTSQEVCGGKLESEEGVFTSPGYPTFLRKNRECEWTIIVPKGRRVKLEFLDLDLDTKAEAYQQGLMFFNGENLVSSIKHLGPKDAVTVIRSSDNLLMVYFWNYETSNSRGFKAKFTSDEPTACDSDFTQRSGILREPQENITGYTCSWTHNMENETSETLALDVLFEAENVHRRALPCRQAYTALIVHVGKNSLAEFCYDFPTFSTIRSPYPMTEVTVSKTRFTKKFNFTVHYQTYACGGILSEPIGTVSSPGYPNLYGARAECAWLIKMPTGQTIKVNFTHFNLDGNCEDSYVIIYNGGFSSDPKIGKYCNSNVLSSFSSQQNQLLIEYHISEKSKATGFQFRYEAVEGGCGGIFHDTKRLIETPNYPKGYPSNAECLWEVNADDGYHVSLEFIDRVHIEESQNCTDDYLQIWDYKDDNWISLPRICGRNVPSSINSTSNRMRILFRSNDNINGAGFKAKWSFKCGGTFEADEKERYIVSPGYPKYYSNNLNCIYNIVAPRKFINVVFEDFSLESGGSTCAFDNVSIVYHQFARWSSVSPSKLYCGTDKPPAVRQRDSVTIIFKTDSWLRAKGFRFSYKTDNCGGVITTPSIISSPTIAGPVQGNFFYLGPMICMWNITAPPDKYVTIQFQSFEFEYNGNCAYDYVEIYDGLKIERSSRLAHLCGNLSHNLPVIKSNGNSMLLRMKTDSSNHFAGFRAAIYFQYGPKVGCGGNIFLNETKTISTPNINDRMDCHWQILTRDEYTIQIKIFNPNLQSECYYTNQSNMATNCLQSFLEIRDGAGPFSEKIDVIRNSSHLPVYLTTTNSAWLRFVGNSRLNRFQIELQALPSQCGTPVLYVTNTTQVLTSPNFPDPYPNNIRCKWLIKLNGTMDRLYLRFVVFDLLSVNETSHACREDRVEIAESYNLGEIKEGIGPNTTYSGKRRLPVFTGSSLMGSRWPLDVHQFCDRNATNHDYYSGRNEIIVSLYGSSKPHGKGFKLEYSPIGCSRNYTAPQGRIINERLKEDCLILITTPESTTISVYFASFLILDEPQCEHVGVVIYDGNSTSSHQIAKLCGYTVPNPIFSTGNQLLIRSYKNHSSSNRPLPFNMFYDLIYVSTSEGRGCGGKIYGSFGKFTSPMYPQIYRKYLNCIWDITVAQGLQVHFKFNVFDIQAPCDNDYIIIKTYNADGSVLDHKFCKDNNPAELVSEINRLTVEYVRSPDDLGTGWSAQFTAVTAGTSVL